MKMIYGPNKVLEEFFKKVKEADREKEGESEKEIDVNLNARYHQKTSTQLEKIEFTHFTTTTSNKLRVYLNLLFYF